MEHFTQIFSDFAGGDVSVRVYEDIESGKTYDNFFVVLGKFITCLLYTSKAAFAVEQGDMTAVEQAVAECTRELKHELAGVDPGMELSLIHI